MTHTDTRFIYVFIFYFIKLLNIIICNYSAISMTNYPGEITHKISTSIIATVTVGNLMIDSSGCRRCFHLSNDYQPFLATTGHVGTPLL